jgi:hypothetical protein
LADITEPDTPRNRGFRDAPHTTPASPAEDARSIALNRVSWGAVLAGVVVALVTHLILNMIGIGFGAATLDPASGDSPTASTFSIGAGIWFAITGIVAALLGGYTAGRLAGQPMESSAGWHGLTTWALTTLVVFWLLTTTVAGLIGGAFNTVTGALGGMGNAVGGAASTAADAAGEAEDPLGSIQAAIGRVIGGETGAPAPAAPGAAGPTEADLAAAREAAAAAVRALLTGDPAQAEQAREAAAQAVAEARGVPVEQARTQIEGIETEYRVRAEELRAQAAETAETAAEAVSTAALLGALGLLLGAVAGWFGGRMGTVEPTLTMATWRAAAGRTGPRS